MFIHLTTHSAFSLQEGLSTPTDLVKAAKANGMTALVPEKLNACTKDKKIKAEKAMQTPIAE